MTKIEESLEQDRIDVDFRTLDLLTKSMKLF